MEEVLAGFFREIAGILGVIAWLSDWPPHSIKSVVDLEIRVNRLRRLVEELHGAIK